MKAINLENQKFGYLTAQSLLLVNGKRNYKCLCICGKELNRTVSQLRAGGEYQSCGCKIHEVYEKLYNLVGEKFGDLVVTKRLGTHKTSKSVLYECLCKLCGKTSQFTSKSLLRKKHRLDQHCGCAGVPGRRLPGNLGIFNKLVGTYKSNAKRKNLRFVLSDEHCTKLFGGNCFYCGVEPKQIFRHKKCHGEFVYNGIDRLDSSGHYAFGNVVSCCSHCNYIKSNTSYSDFANWIDRVYNYRIVSKYKCSLCGTLLKQIMVNSDDSILSCPDCKMGNDSAFELRFDVDGYWLMGYCALPFHGKPMVMKCWNQDEDSYTEIYEAYLNQVNVPQNILRIGAKTEIENLNEEKLKIYLTFS